MSVSANRSAKPQSICLCRRGFIEAASRYVWSIASLHAFNLKQMMAAALLVRGRRRRLWLAAALAAGGFLMFREGSAGLAGPLRALRPLHTGLVSGRGAAGLSPSESRPGFAGAVGQPSSR